MRIKTMSKPKKLEPISPGEMLLEEFLKPLGNSQYRLAKEIGVPAQRIGEIVAGRRSVTADTIYACAASSVSPTAGGFAGRRATTWNQPRTLWRTR